MKTCVTDRDELKSRVVLFSLEKFMADSVSNVRMDDISAEMGISKRTLYELFESKEQLLLACILHIHRKVESDMQTRLQNQDDIISVSMLHFAFLLKTSKSVSTGFFEQIDKYPMIKSYFDERNRTMMGRVRSYLELGVKQGVFRSDINFSVVMKTIEILIQYMISNRYTLDFTMEDMVYSMILVEMRGISTQKGLALIEQFDINNIQIDEKDVF